MKQELRFSGLGLSKGGRAILSGVDGRLRSGEVTAILGPNGAGKSSLLHCLAGLEPRMAGTVTIGARALTDMPAGARARAIGFLPQRGEVHWNLSVRAAVALGRAAHGVRDEDAAIIDRAMAQMDIAVLAERGMQTLSGGEQARALLARVLAGAPDWLLADEPLASLDPAHQLAVLARLRAVADEGTGVIVVLHDINHAARVADHVILMKDGAIIADGPTGEVLTPALLHQAFGVTFRRVTEKPPVLIAE